MAPLTFRIWHKTWKKWLFGYEDRGGFSLLGEVVMLGELSSIPLSQLHELVVMQSTGLKDKNGKEIFEGDILSDGVYMSAVVWNAAQGMWETKYDGGGIFFHREVIGNVHQHPELLERK